MFTISSKQYGFSLLEILVAFSILSMTLGVIYQIFSRGSQHIILADEYAKASIIAQSKLAIVGLDTSHSSGETKGIIDKKYRWSVSMRPFIEYERSDSTIDLQLYAANTRISWNSLGKEHVLEINTLKLLADD